MRIAIWLIGGTGLTAAVCAAIALGGRALRGPAVAIAFTALVLGAAVHDHRRVRRDAAPDDSWEAFERDFRAFVDARADTDNFTPNT